MTSIEVGGVPLERPDARSGQLFTWRFRTCDRWWEAHPFSLLAALDEPGLRITVKGARRLHGAGRAIPSGTRAIAEGLFGAFTVVGRRRRRWR